MKTKNFKEKLLRDTQQNNGYVLKSQIFHSTSPPSQAPVFKINTHLNKENVQPNVIKTQRFYANNQTNLGWSKQFFRQSVDDLKLKISNKNQQTQSRNFQNFSKKNPYNINFLTRSNNFNAFPKKQYGRLDGKKHLKTEEPQYISPVIQDCEFIQSQYESQNSDCEQEKLSFAKCYRKRLKMNNRQISIHESMHYDSQRPVTFGGNNQFNTYFAQRQEQKKMKNEILNSIFLKNQVELMKSWDYDTTKRLKCTNHPSKKAKYRLNSLTDDQQVNYYCQKCAFNLAKQQFDIEQIQPEQDGYQQHLDQNQATRALYQSIEIQKDKMKRQNNFVSFQKRLEQLEFKINQQLQLFNKKSEGMKRIDRKIQMTVQNYDKLIAILEEMRDKQIQKEEQIRKQKSIDINHTKDELSAMLGQINCTFKEIKHQKSKMLAMKKQQFNFIFHEYFNKIDKYEEYLNKLESSQLDKQIANFDLNMSAEDIDEEKMIQQIFDQMYQKILPQKLEVINQESEDLSNNKFTRREVEESSEIVDSSCDLKFYCVQDDEQKIPPPFRALFNDNNAYSNTDDNVNSSSLMNQSIQQSIKYFKESNNFQNFRNFSNNFKQQN